MSQKENRMRKEEGGKGKHKYQFLKLKFFSSAESSERGGAKMSCSPSGAVRVASLPCLPLLQPDGVELGEPMELVSQQSFASHLSFCHSLMETKNPKQFVGGWDGTINNTHYLWPL